MIKIIGIDPGLAATGVGVVSGSRLKVYSFSYGSINTSKKYSLPNRLEQIFSGIFSVIKDEAPDLMVVEDIFSLRENPKSGISLGKVSGVILLAGCKADVPVVEIPAREAKQIITGNGNASKAQLEEAVRSYLNLHDPIRPFHASDALSMALIGLFRS